MKLVKMEWKAEKQQQRPQEAIPFLCFLHQDLLKKTIKEYVKQRKPAWKENIGYVMVFKICGLQYIDGKNGKI